ncbi:MAG: tRNA (adenosine(37)-N6)-threonylcarbamoyltransferase complex ATPase subunit type 1 TsaE [Pseudomonadota bacterium]
MMHSVLPDPVATERFAETIAGYVRPGDIIALYGDLGAGKTSFARALIRAVSANPGLVVPSPTFSLLQTYDEADACRIVHVDFYRLSEPDDALELGLDDLALASAILAEWPDRGVLPDTGSRLDITFSSHGSGRCAELNVIGDAADWAARITRALECRDFLDRAGWDDARRARLQGDASTRRYERLVRDDRKAILMDAPARPDPGQPGAPAYSRIVHLAEDCKPFVAIADGLRAQGLAAPEVLAADLERGLLLIEDLGVDGPIVDDAPVAERYLTAARVLAHLHAANLPDTLPLRDGTTYRLPSYDTDVMITEARLLIEWYAPERLDGALPDEAVDAFDAAVRRMVAPLAAADASRSWVLRDVHSPNLIWRGDKSGLDRIGLIDFQDALIGPPVYDLASLAYDARIDMPRELSLAIIDAYEETGRAEGLTIDRDRLDADLARMAAQRNAKILGIFVRLARRDGKHGYLTHLSHVTRYFYDALNHPACADLASWCARWLPRDRQAAA